MLAEYRLHHGTYKATAAAVSEVLRLGLKLPATKIHLEARAKTPASYTLKALRKIREKPDIYAADPLKAMPDKAGVRVVLADLASVHLAVDQIRELLDVYEVDDKRLSLDPNELGYLAVHIGARLRPGQGIDAQLLDVQCEVQVHTIAQSGWADVSHPLLYKPVGVQPSKEVESRVLRAMALVSLFDDEISGAQGQVKADPLYRPATMLAALTAAAIDWRTSDPDHELSLEVLRVVERAYLPHELDAFEELIVAFVEVHRASIAAAIAQYAGSDDVELIGQPEAIAVFERLRSRPEALRTTWINSDLPLELLDELATAYPV